MTQRLEKQSLTTPKVRWLIYLIEECCKSGEIDDVNFLCKYTMPFSSSIQNPMRIQLYLECCQRLNKPFHWSTAETLLSPTA